MKTNKFPTTEKEVQEFEDRNKHFYEYPKEWSTIDEIINSDNEPNLKKYWEANCSSARQKVVEHAFMLIHDLKKQLKLHGVIDSFGEQIKPILGVLTQEQVDKGVSNCDLCKYKKHTPNKKECVECVNYGVPNQYYL